MIEVEAPDGSIVEFPEGTDDATILRVMRQAFGAPAAPAPTRRTASPEELAAAVARSEGMDAQAAQAMGVRPNTALGVMSDVAGAAGAGLARGGMELLGLPGTLDTLGGKAITGLLNMATGAELAAPESALSGSALRGYASDATGGATEYRGQTMPAQFAGTVGEFLPGAAIGGLNPANLMRYGVLPGMASEAAGQVTEGTAIEPYARMAAGLLAPAITARAGAFVGDEAAAMANRVRDAGVRGVTAGQAKGSSGLMRAEGRLQPTAGQLDDYTAAIMKQIGSPATKATPDALLAAETAIVKQMDDAVAGVSIVPDVTHYRGAAKVAADYIERVPAGQLTPRVKGIAAEIFKASRSKSAVDLRQLKEWRSDIGRLTVSPDAATREAAHGLREVIDGMTDQALLAANRGADIAALAKGREAYRNYIGIRDAASRAGAEAGTLSPQALNQSVIRAQGREAYATGRTTPMSELTRAGAAVLRPAPTVMAGGQRAVSGGVSAGLASAGAAAAYGAGGGPLGILASGLLGVAAPSLGQAVMRSGPVQAIMRNPKAMANAAKLAPGILAQQGQK